MRSLPVLLLVCAGLVGACSAPTEGDDPASSGAAATAGTEPTTSDHTFVLKTSAPQGVRDSWEFDGGKAHLRLAISDPIVKEVTNQDDMGPATIDAITVTLYKVDTKTRDRKALSNQVLAVHARGEELKIVKPSADDFLDSFISGTGRYAISAERIRTGTSTFFTEIDMKVTVTRD
jgi:hypothetical protein